MVLYKDETSPNTRPLLPTDEDQLNIQLFKNLQNNNVISSNSFNSNITNESGYSYKEIKLSQRSSSNKNMENLLVDRSNIPVQKALTDTNNFIEIFNHNESRKHPKDKDIDCHLKEDYSLEESISQTDNDISDEVFIGSIDNTEEKLEVPKSVNVKDEKDNSSTVNSINSYGLSMDGSAKKRYDEWAERGAAKIVQEVTNPNTGEKYKKVVKKGIKDFKFGEMIGDGAYSTVMLATSLDTGKKYAVKVLNKTYLIKQKKVKYVNIEKNALQRVNNSKSIIKLYFTFQDEASLYLLLEYAPNGDLLTVMKKYGSLNEYAACYYSAQIIDAIDFLHLNGIIHRDIKPENILLDKEWKIKITDFGTARILEHDPNTKKFDLLTRSNSFVGTAEYVSPELLNDSFVDSRCDIWAFGCILFQMIAGKPPFKATNEYLTFQKVMKVQYAFTAGFPTVVRDLVKRILVKQMDQRLTISEIEKHPFYKNKNFKDGSIWTDQIPELSGYKVNAKSMLPMPDLKDIYPHKRPGVNHGMRSVSSTVINTSSGNASPALSYNTGLPISSSHTISSISDSNSSGSGIPDLSSRKVSDNRTSAILENARRSVSSRKQSKSKRAPSGAALAASLAFNKTNSQTAPGSTLISTSGSPQIHPENNNEIQQHGYGHSNTTKKYSSNTHRHSSSTIPESRRKPADSAASSKQGSSLNSSKNARTEELNKGSSDRNVSKVSVVESLPSQAISKVAHATVNKLDIAWSFYLKDIGEHVIRLSEFNISILETGLLEKRLTKVHKYPSDPQIFNSNTRSTLLSQVARSGGEITGLRSGFRIPEEKYYSSNLIDFENIKDEFRVMGSDLSTLLMMDSEYDNRMNTNSQSSTRDSNDSVTTSKSTTSGSSPGPNQITNSEDIGHSLFSGKVKKLFHYTKQSPPPVPNNMITVEHERFMRRIAIVTNYGRIITFVKRKSISTANDQLYSLCYDIDLCQMGVSIKEIPMSDPSNNLIVIQTPYKSFILGAVDAYNTEKKESFNTSWFKTLKKCIKMGTDHKKHIYSRNVPSSSNAVQTGPDTPTSSIKKIDVSSSKNPLSPNLGNLHGNSSQMENQASSSVLPTIRSGSGENKHTLFSQSGSNSTKNRKSRMFNPYVSSKEKLVKKQNKSSIPTNSKLVNGLPSSSHTTILGLGLSSSKAKNSASHGNSSEMSKINLRHK